MPRPRLPAGVFFACGVRAGLQQYRPVLEEKRGHAPQIMNNAYHGQPVVGLAKVFVTFI